MPQYNSSKKHLVLISQHGISFLLASTQDQRGFPLLGDLSEVPPLLLRGRGRQRPCEPRDTRGFLRRFCEEQTNFDGASRAFCGGQKGGSGLVWVGKGCGTFGGLFHPPFCAAKSLFWVSWPQTSQLSSPAGIREEETRARAAPPLSSLPYSSCSNSSLGLTGVPGLGRKKIYKTLLNQQ